MYGGVFNCPSKDDFKLTGGDGYYISYAINGFCYDESGALRRDENGNSGGPYFWYQKMNFLEPSVLMAADAHLLRNDDIATPNADAIPVLRNNDYLYNIRFLPLYHSYGHNVLFTGGDVQRVPVRGMYYTLRKLAH